MATIKVLIAANPTAAELLYGAEYASYHPSFNSWLGDTPANGGPDDLTVSQNSIIVETTDDFIGESNALVEAGVSVTDSEFNSSATYFVTIRPRQDIPFHGYQTSQAVTLMRTTRFEALEIGGFHRVEDIYCLSTNGSGGSNGIKFGDDAVMSRVMAEGRNNGSGFNYGGSTGSPQMLDCVGFGQSGCVSSKPYTAKNCLFIGVGPNYAMRIDARDTQECRNTLALSGTECFDVSAGTPPIDNFTHAASTDATASVVCESDANDNIDVSSLFVSGETTLIGISSSGDFRLKATADTANRGNVTDGQHIGPDDAYEVSGAPSEDVFGSLIGDAQISGLAGAEKSVSGSLVGSAVIAGLVSLSLGVSGSLVGSAQMAGSVSAERGASGSLAGDAQISGVATSDVGVSGALTGDAQISGTTFAERYTSGVLTGDGQITGLVSSELSASGVLLGDAQISGSVFIGIGENVSGSLVGDAVMAGATNVTRVASGSIFGDGQISGAISLTYSTSGIILGSASVNGAISVSLGAYGAITGDAQIRGSAFSEAPDPVVNVIAREASYNLVISRTAQWSGVIRRC